MGGRRSADDVALRTPALRVALAVAIMIAAATSAACDADRPVLSGAVQVTVVTEDDTAEPFGRVEFQVRLIGVDGSIRDQAIPWPGGAGPAIPVPAGAYRAEMWTVYTSDATECERDPSAPGGQRCVTEETTDRPCGVDIEVQSGIVAITYRNGVEDWACVLAEPGST